MMQNTLKLTETHAKGCSSESTQEELSNEYQHDRVSIVFKNLCVLVLWTEAASTLDGLMPCVYCWDRSQAPEVPTPIKESGKCCRSVCKFNQQ